MLIDLAQAVCPVNNLSVMYMARIQNDSLFNEHSEQLLGPFNGIRPRMYMEGHFDHMIITS